jgi:hypothetical protein
MAAGAVKLIAKYIHNMALTGLPDLWASDTIKMGIITNAVTPSLSDSDPRWGAGGGQNYSTAEVTPGGNYSAGGITVAGNAVAFSAPNVNLQCTSPISLAANASNPTGAYWGIFYSSTDAGKRVLGYVDLGGPLSLVNGLQINVAGVSSGTQTLFQGTAI